jgi:hypothetical protein
MLFIQLKSTIQHNRYHIISTRIPTYPLIGVVGIRFTHPNLQELAPVQAIIYNRGDAQDFCHQGACGTNILGALGEFFAAGKHQERIDLIIQEGVDFKNASARNPTVAENLLFEKFHATLQKGIFMDNIVQVNGERRKE